MKGLFLLVDNFPNYRVSLKMIAMKKTAILLFTIFTFILFSTVQAQMDTTHFVTTWQTDSAGFSNDSAIFIEVDTSYTYNFDIDWDNDGIFDTIGVDSSILIQYPRPGTYTVRIRGIYPSIYFSSTGFFPTTVNYDQDKLISIDQWGNNPWQSLSSAFLNCSNLTNSATDTPNLNNVTNLYEMFSGASSFNADLSNWNVSTITSMAYMFQAAFAFNGNITNWDVSNVRDMNAMFADAYNFNQDVTTWDVSSVYSTDLMFANSAFNQDISNWNLSAVIDISAMFLFARQFNQDISNWDIPNVRSMVSLFDSSGLSRTNYDKILFSWQAKPHLMNVTLGAAGIKYCLGDSVRTLLIADGWSFNGDSLDCLAIGLQENDLVSNIRFYPNPAKNTINIESELQVNRINIYSAVGAIVKSSTQSIFSVQEIPAGTYVIEVITKHGIKKELLIKQ